MRKQSWTCARRSARRAMPSNRPVRRSCCHGRRTDQQALRPPVRFPSPQRQMGVHGHARPSVGAPAAFGGPAAQVAEPRPQPARRTSRSSLPQGPTVAAERGRDVPAGTEHRALAAGCVCAARWLLAARRIGPARSAGRAQAVAMGVTGRGGRQVTLRVDGADAESHRRRGSVRAERSLRGRHRTAASPKKRPRRASAWSTQRRILWYCIAS